METNELQRLIGEWGNSTFMSKKEDTHKIILHLVEEVLELANVSKNTIKEIQKMVKPSIINNPDPVEAADVMMLLIHVAHVSGFSLEEEVLKKFEECKQRVWKAPDDNGIIKHAE